MQRWALESAYYHIVIDRFATSGHTFQYRKGAGYSQDLQHWMGGKLRGITQSLDYIQNLGINAILLTPFFEGNKYHGYWTTNPCRVEPHFGNKQDLRELIDYARKRNIRMIMDLPVTHCHILAHPASDAMKNKQSCYRNWFHYEANGRFRGFFGDHNLPELNLEHPRLKTTLKKIISYWLSLGFEGIRFDHAKRPSHSLWREITAHLQAQHPEVCLLGENWSKSNTVGTLADYLHGELNIPVSNALRSFLSQPGTGTIEELIRQIHAQRSLRQAGYLLPTFLDSHDVERVAYLTHGNQALLALGYFLQLTLPYPPIIYYGSERAQTQSDNLPTGKYERDRFFREPMDWHNGKDMAAWVKKLLAIRHRHINFFSSEPYALKILRGNIVTYSYTSDSSHMMILANFSPSHRDVRLPSEAINKLAEGDQIRQASRSVKLEPYGGAILISSGWTPLNTVDISVKV